MVRFQISLDPIEADLLSEWARAELRDPRDQIRYLLRRQLRYRYKGWKSSRELRSLYNPSFGEATDDHQ